MISFKVILIVVLSIWIIIAKIAIKESIRQHEINASFVPVEVIFANRLICFDVDCSISKVSVTVDINNSYWQCFRTSWNSICYRNR
ncbi:hypothetical protein D3C78_1127900 [compost metagenome]